MARRYLGLKNEFEQLLLTQVSGFGCTLRQANDEVEALGRKRMEQGALSPADNARIEALLFAPEMKSLSSVRGEMNRALQKYHVAKEDLEQVAAALANNAQHSPKMVDAALTHRHGTDGRHSSPLVESNKNLGSNDIGRETLGAFKKVE